MDAFDMISEPVLFVQALHAHSSRVHHGVELVRLLVDALLTEDGEKMRTLYEQMSGIKADVDRSRLSLYGQIKDMRFHSAGGDAFSQYMGCQDKVADSSQTLAELLMLRETVVPAELRDDLQAFVAEVVNISGRTVSLTEALCAAQTGCPEAGTQDWVGATQQIAADNSRAGQCEMAFARRLYGLETQLAPVTVMFLDQYRAALREVADNAERAADYLRLMIR
jgi:predicted phosphate transport protein (TIGR00153 family)